MSGARTQRPHPQAMSVCVRCGVLWPDLSNAHLEVVVSPAGKAHFGSDYGTTVCGIDATGPKWWWPL